MQIRGSTVKDAAKIHAIYDHYKYNLDIKHLENIAVAVDDNGEVIGIMVLTTVLECTFLTNPTATRRSKIDALKALVAVGRKSVKDLGYELVHAFANDKIKGILSKHFGFQRGEGTNLVLFVEE